MSFLDLTHWPVPKGRVYQLEATAYALLALVKAQVSKDTVALLAIAMLAIVLPGGPH